MKKREEDKGKRRDRQLPNDRLKNTRRTVTYVFANLQGVLINKYRRVFRLEMKRKAPFTSPGKQNYSSDSVKQAGENNSSSQLNQPRLKDESVIWNSVTRAEIISALKGLGSDKKQLDKET